MDDEPNMIGATEVVATSVDMAMLAMPGASLYTMAEQVRIGVESGLRVLLDLGVVEISPLAAWPEQVMWPSPDAMSKVAAERAERREVPMLRSDARG